jgi:hypothetical protein
VPFVVGITFGGDHATEGLTGDGATEVVEANFNTTISATNEHAVASNH